MPGCPRGFEDSPAAEWNEKHPGRAVEKGDIVWEVNGSEDPEKMFASFETALVVRLRLMKDVSSTASSPSGAGGAWDAYSDIGDAALRDPKTLFELEPEQRAAEQKARGARSSMIADNMFGDLRRPSKATSKKSEERASSRASSQAAAAKFFPDAPSRSASSASGVLPALRGGP